MSESVEVVERWLPVRGWEEHYVVSDRGRVARARTRRVLKPFGPARQVALHRRTERCRVPVSQLVLGAFVGPQPPGHRARHLNGDPDDSRAENLAWMTSAGIAREVRLAGCATTKLSADAVREIRRRRAAGEDAAALAADFRVHPVTICNVLSGKSWGWVV